MTVPDRTTELPEGFRAGDHVRWETRRTDTGTLVRAEHDGDGSVVLVVKSDRNGGLRVLRPETVRRAEPKRRRTRRTAAPTADS